MNTVEPLYNGHLWWGGGGGGVLKTKTYDLESDHLKNDDLENDELEIENVVEPRAKFIVV